MAAIIRGKGIYGYVDTSKLFRRGHSVYEWHAAIGREIVRYAKAEAPVRTGALKNSIYSSGPDHMLGPTSNLLEVKVGARRRYSIWVHEGVDGRIYPKNGKRLKLSSTPGGASPYREPIISPKGETIGGVDVGRRMTGSIAIGWPTHVRGANGATASVAGQDANPFLARALSTAAVRHRWRGGRTRLVR